MPAAPYKVDRVQASGKFPEPILNTPRSITVLSKEVLQDKNITSLREVGRSTAGVTLGSGEGGNAFGDRFFIRGFDARNDVFIDGIRDPAVSIRENFFTEQIEILRGPASSYAGRGTAGGAINIVTKQATGFQLLQRRDLVRHRPHQARHARRQPGDQPDLLDSRRRPVPGRQRRRPQLRDRRSLGRIHLDQVDADRQHQDHHELRPHRPQRPAGLRRALVQAGQHARHRGGRHPAPELVRLRQSRLPDRAAGFRHADRRVQGHRQHHADQPDPRGALAAGLYRHAAQLACDDRLPIRRDWTFTASPQSRNQWVDILANQEEATFKFNTGSVKHNAAVGLEVSNERVGIDRYTGLASEAFGAGFSGNGALANQSIYLPTYTFAPFNNVPSLIGNPTRYNVDSKAVYVTDTANWQDTIIVNGGLRYDGYDLRSSNNTASASVNSDFINYNVGIVFKPAPIGSVYAAYATSTNPFGSELDGTATDYGGVPPSATTILGPERNRAAEVGTKWELFDRHLLVTGALFHTEKDNARETVAGVLTSGAAYQIDGVDIEVSGNITDRWSVFGGLVLMRSKVTQSGIPSNVGLQLANIAHESFSMLSKYKFDYGWELGGQAVYRSKIYGGTFGANTGTELPSYWRFDAFVEKKIDKNWTMKLYAQNLTNKLYYDTLYRSATPFVAVAPGRAFYLVTSAKF